MPSHVKLMAILIARPGKVEALKALLNRMVPHCRAERGNLRWDIWQDQSQRERFVLDELYVDAAAVASHRDTPHFKDYLARINDLAERTVFALDPVQPTEVARDY